MWVLKIDCHFEREARATHRLEFFYRFAFNDDTLPEWFEQEEQQHRRVQLPITKVGTYILWELNLTEKSTPQYTACAYTGID